LDGGEGDKNAMIAPQVPAGGLIRQAILHDEPHGQRNNPMGVMGLGQGVVGHVRVEVFPTMRATMLGVDDVDVAWPTGDQVANIVQDSFACSTAETGFTTKGTRAMREVSRAANDLSFGQIFGSRDTFGDVGQILSGARHSKSLLGRLFQPRNLQDLLGSVIVKCLF
jgi:hypothetical protein